MAVTRYVVLRDSSEPVPFQAQVLGGSRKGLWMTLATTGLLVMPVYLTSNTILLKGTPFSQPLPLCNLLLFLP